MADHRNTRGTSDGERRLECGGTVAARVWDLYGIPMIGAGGSGAAPGAPRAVTQRRPVRNNVKYLSQENLHEPGFGRARSLSKKHSHLHKIAYC
jgi:hypothetical protein